MSLSIKRIRVKISSVSSSMISSGISSCFLWRLVGCCVHFSDFGLWSRRVCRAGLIRVASLTIVIWVFCRREGGHGDEITMNCFSDGDTFAGLGRASRLPNMASREGVPYVRAARIPDIASSRPFPVCLSFPRQHGGHRRTNPNGGRKEPHNDGEKGIDTGSSKKACSRQTIGVLNRVFVHSFHGFNAS